MSKAIGREIQILLPQMEIGDHQKLLKRAQELATQERFRGQINGVRLSANELIIIVNSDVFEHDIQEQNQLKKVHRRANRFIRELGIYIFGNKIATTRNLWEIQWRPQIEFLMNNAITHDMVDNHLAAIMLMIPCIDRAFTIENPQGDTGYTTAMLKWAFPENAVDISTKDYKKCIKEMRDGLINGLKHDSFLRGSVYIHNAENNPNPFYVNGDFVIVNPHAFWTHVRNKIDDYYADLPRNLSIGS